MEPYKSTFNYTRPYLGSTLSDRVKKPGLLRRLTAPGSDVKDFEQTVIAFAGRSVGKDGLVMSREEMTEVWTHGEGVFIGNAEVLFGSGGSDSTIPFPPI